MQTSHISWIILAPDSCWSGALILWITCCMHITTACEILELGGNSALGGVYNQVEHNCSHYPTYFKTTQDEGLYLYRDTTYSDSYWIVGPASMLCTNFGYMFSTPSRTGAMPWEVTWKENMAISCLEDTSTEPAETTQTTMAITTPASPTTTQLDGENWNIWSNWSTCSSTCGCGYKHRLKFCDSESLHLCNDTMVETGQIVNIGYSIEMSACYNAPCVGNETWSSWGAWTNCSAPCGIGTHQRRRLWHGATPPDRIDCSGIDSQTEICEAPDCKTDKVKRKKKAATEVFTKADKRVSAKAMGAIAIAFITIELTFVVCFDLISVKQYARQCLRNIGYAQL